MGYGAREPERGFGVHRVPLALTSSLLCLAAELLAY